MLGKWEWQDRELKHCFAELPGISRSWTCRNCWPGLRSRVHTIAVYPAREITMGGESTLWPLHFWHIPPQRSHLLHTRIPNILPLLAHLQSSLCLHFNLTCPDFSPHNTNERNKLFFCFCLFCFVFCCSIVKNVLISTKRVWTHLVVLKNIILNMNHTIWLFLLCDQVYLHLWGITGTFFLSVVSHESILAAHANTNRKKLHLHTCSCQSFLLTLKLVF